MKREDITTETEEIKKNHQILLQKPILNTLEYTEEKYYFLDRYKISKLNQDQIDHPNSPITPKEIEGVIEILPKKKKKKKSTKNSITKI